MSSRRKINAIIVIIMILIAGYVLYMMGYISKPDSESIPDIIFDKDEENDILTVLSVSDDEILWYDIKIDGDCDQSTLGKYIQVGDQITDCIGVIKIYHRPTDTLLYTYKFEPAPKLPTSTILGNMRDVSPKDEGAHYKTILNLREWWYYTVVFNKDSELAGWAATIGFCHMAWGDLRLTFKPDILVVTLHSPDGKEYGGLINKERKEILGVIGSSTLEANTPGVDLKYENSWAKGKSPKWHVHAEDKEIDKDNDIVLDLDFFAPSYPYWVQSNALFDKGNGNIASYIFTGCEVTGEIILDGATYAVEGIGHHEHSWSLGVAKFFIKGWDWCHMRFNNGWNIYYSKYYLTNQILDKKTSRINPYATIIITTDNGETLTLLEDIDITTQQTDTLFLLLKMPSRFTIKAKTSISQILLRSFNINLNIDIIADNTYDKTWKFPTYLGMKIGLSTVTGKIQWSDTDGDNEIELKGSGTIWNMRKV
ncbi:hypothetical protein AYK20_09705 [Thermoplasmatales archaeon SG8-52-1]|nr:MAG: hypothetical protein AYK20_09705 [Thermoplasmatales archaeon SG8-52-1]